MPPTPAPSIASAPKSAQTIMTHSPAGEANGADQAGLARSLGIVSHLTETYSVGGYRYTTLTDAIAQARRMTKLENELL